MEERGQRIEQMADIYENADAVKRHETSTVTENNDSPWNLQTQNPTGDTDKRRHHRLIAASLLVLLIVLLLVGVVVLWVMFNTQTTSNNKLQTEKSNLTISREQLQISYDNLTTRYDQLQTKYNNLTVEQKQLISSYNNLTNDRNQLQKERDELNTWLSTLDNGWSYFNSSIYYISTGTNNWSESRQDCIGRGADLVIINSNAEKDFIEWLKRGASYVWIGLTDSAVEGTWKWVDGSAPTYMYWEPGQPGKPGTIPDEDCAQFREKWHDYPCSVLYAWICEKRI